MGKKSHTVSTHKMLGQPRFPSTPESKEVVELEKMAAKALNAQEEINAKKEKLKKDRERVSELTDLCGEIVEKMGKTEVVLGGCKIKVKKAGRKTTIKRLPPQKGELKPMPGDKKGAKKVEATK